MSGFWGDGYFAIVGYFGDAYWGDGIGLGLRGYTVRPARTAAGISGPGVGVGAVPLAGQGAASQLGFGRSASVSVAVGRASGVVVPPEHLPATAVPVGNAKAAGPATGRTRASRAPTIGRSRGEASVPPRGGTATQDMDGRSAAEEPLEGTEKLEGP